MAQITGRVTVKVNGEILLNKSGWTLHLGGVNRNVVTGDGGVHGYAEETVAPQCSGNLSHTEALDLEALGAIADATVLFETDTGQAYVLRNAWVTEPPVLTAGEGETSLTFMAISAERLR